MFVPGKPFQPSLMFASKAGAYPNEAPFRCSTLGWAFTTVKSFIVQSWSLSSIFYMCNLKQGILMGKNYCTIDLLFDWFGLVRFADKNKICQ